MKKDQIFILKDRGVIYISGEDAKDFLQNIVTNDINKVSDTSSCLLHCLLLKVNICLILLLSNTSRVIF